MINYYPWAVYCESPPSFIWGEGGAKNEGLLYLQSTIDIHILNMFRLTVDIHFQNTLLLSLSLLLCSLLLPNCEGSHSVRLFPQDMMYYERTAAEICNSKSGNITEVIRAAMDIDEMDSNTGECRSLPAAPLLWDMTITWLDCQNDRLRHLCLIGHSSHTLDWF